MNTLIKITINGKELLLGAEDALEFFSNYFISHPFDHTLDETLSAILFDNDLVKSGLCQSGLKVDVLGRERFTSKLTKYIDIENLKTSATAQIVQFDNLSPELKYPQSLSFNNRNVASFSERAAPKRTHQVVSLNDARICVSPLGFAIFDKDGQYINNVCLGDGILLALTNPENLPATKVFEGTLVPLCSVWSNGYFHWILEVLPKLLLILKAGIKFSEIDAFLIRQNSPQLMEFMNHLGIPSEKIFLWQENSHLIAKRLIFTSSLENYDYTVSPNSILIEPWVSRELHKHYALPCQKEKSRRIYIDREGALIRKVINNTEVKALLSEYGFEFCKLEKMSLQEKQELFSCAEIIVGPAGAGFTNLVFCNENAKVLILYQKNFEPDSFWSLCNNNKLHHFHLVCESSQPFFPSKFSNTLNEDFLININELKSSIDYLIGYNIT